MNLKITLKFVLLLVATIIVTGCGQKPLPPYTPDVSNAKTYDMLKANNTTIKLGTFTDGGKNHARVMCRGFTAVPAPMNKPYYEYIRNNFLNELQAAKIYDVKSSNKITLNLDKIYSSSKMGNAYWEFIVTVKSSNGKSLKVKSIYKYSSSFSAASACSDMRTMIVPAVEKLISEIVNNKDFPLLLNKK